MRAFLAAAIGFTLFSCNLAAKTTYSLVNQQANIELDGKLTETAWQSATKVELDWQIEPPPGIPAKVKTTAWMFEDGEFIYVAFDAKDPNPQQIQGALREHDGLYGDDNVVFMIDTFNDERTGYEFFVNPYNAQGDMRMTDYNTWDEDLSWNAIWYSGAQINDDGYTVEMKIPLSSIRFQEKEGEQTWGLSVYRNYPREVRYQFSNVNFDLDIKCSFCQFDKLTGFANTKPSNNLQITPTVTGLRHQARLDDWQTQDTEFEGGVDIRWGITNNDVLNATINPDFSQVEADAKQLDVNTRYALFYSEKRPFFIEGSDYFKSNGLYLVHTRNIAEPDVGLKYTGKQDEHTYAGLFANDKQSTIILPSTESSNLVTIEEKANIGIGRYQYQLNQNNSFAALVTSRSSENYHNNVAAIEGLNRLSEQTNLSYQVVYSDTENTDSIASAYGLDKNQTGYALRTTLEKETKDYHLFGSYKKIDSDFRADLGFINSVGTEEASVYAGYTWYNEAGSLISNYGTYGDIDVSYNEAGDLLEREYELSFEFKGAYRSTFDTGIVSREEKYLDNYFDTFSSNMFINFYPVKNVRVQTYLAMGDKVDYRFAEVGDRIYSTYGFKWDINQHYQLDINYIYSHLKHHDVISYRSNIVDFKFNTKFTSNSVLRIAFQYQYDKINSNPFAATGVLIKSRDFATQILYSYQLDRQMKYYLGYSDSGYAVDEESLKPLERSFFTKFSYTFQL